MNEIIERNGKRYRVRIERDEDMGDPWKEHDGHGEEVAEDLIEELAHALTS